MKNLDKIKKREKEYYLNNLDKLKKSQIEYNKNNLTKIKEREKEYRIKNIDKLKTSEKDYRITNKDKIKDKRREMIFQNNPHYVPLYSWKSREQSRKNLELIASQLQITNLSDWYRISWDQIKQFGGKILIILINKEV
jgi:hypothetical protein